MPGAQKTTTRLSRRAKANSEPLQTTRKNARERDRLQSRQKKRQWTTGTRTSGVAKIDKTPGKEMKETRRKNEQENKQEKPRKAQRKQKNKKHTPEGGIGQS